MRYVRAQVESQVLLLKKGRLAKFADKVHLMLDAMPPITIHTYYDYVNYLIIMLFIIILIRSFGLLLGLENWVQKKFNCMN